MQKHFISPAVIRRLPRYYRYLSELLEEGIERISSSELSRKMNVTASQIRQDLNNFGGFGQQGYGYNVQYLYTEIGKILGLDQQYHLIIIGAGNLGRALANYKKFEDRGFKIKGIFDSDLSLCGQPVAHLTIQHVNQLERFIKEENISIAALTLPKEQAEDMAKQLVDYGIQGIWNFAHTDLQLVKNVLVENVHLSESLMRLSYRLTNR